MLNTRLNFFKYSDFTYLFISFLVARLIFAYYLPLGVDEAYQITVGRQLDWSYYDHPPLSFWAPNIFSKFFGFEAPVVYRLPAIIFGCVTVYALYGIGILIRGRDAAFWGAFLYSVSPFLFFSGGVFVVPDGPLNAAICMTIFLFIRSQNSKINYNIQLLLVGVCLALSFLSKYHAVLVPISLLLYFLASKKRVYWILHSRIWIVALVGVLGFLPTLIWNFYEGWPSLTFHTDRANAEFNLINFMKMFFGQLIYLLPPTLFLSIWMFFSIQRDEKINFLFYPALFIIISFNVLYILGAEGFPHWTMPGWMLSLPLVGVFINQKNDLLRKKIKRWCFSFIIPFWAIILVLAIHVNTGWLTSHLKSAPKWDDTIQFMHWDDFSQEFDKFCCDGKKETIGFLNWMDASLIGVTLKGKHLIRVIGENPHHFIFMDKNPKPIVGYLLVPTLINVTDEAVDELFELIKAYDPDASYFKSIGVKRGKFDYAQVLVFKMLLPKQKKPRFD